MAQVVSFPGREAPGTATEPPGVGDLAMVLLLAALGVLFLAGVVAYLVIRARFDAWPARVLLPGGAGVWLSLGIIAVSSLTQQLASNAIRAGRHEALTRWTALTFLLGLLFLANQVVCWVDVLPGSELGQAARLFVFLFYVMTVLHAAHVLGGLAALGVVLFLATRGRYGADRWSGVRHATVYWHFLGIVWAVLAVVLSF